MDFSSSNFSIDSIMTLRGSGELVLQPDFQRFYIWDRKKEEGLIDSIVRGYPIPPIWLWRHSNEERLIYEVIDGQQRLTCILKFTQNKFKFKALSDSPGSDDLKQIDNSFFDKIPLGEEGQIFDVALRKKFRGYEIPFVKVQTEDRKQIIDIFKRLNKSSTNLNPQELRNAFYTGEFKSSVYNMTAILQDNSFWGGVNKVFQKPSTDRMSNHQYISDLYVAMIEGEPQHQSEKLDDYYEKYDTTWRDRKSTEKRFDRSLKFIKGLLPDASRFTNNLSDFYTLFLLIDNWLNDRTILMDDNDKQVIRESLRKFELDYGLFVDARAGDRTEYGIFEEYRETIVGRQREKEVRIKRGEILTHLIIPGLKRVDLDVLRSFSQEQKLYIWQISPDKRCKICGGVVDSFEDYEPDHIKPWTKGGRTSIVNGQVSHRVCNRKKQAKFEEKKK